MAVPVGPFGVTAGDSITIKSAHTFATPNTGFMKFQLTPQKNKAEYKVVGDLGLGKFNGSVDVFIAGSYAALHETIQKLLNVPLIVLYKDANCDANQYVQLGCDCQSAWFTGDYATGTTKDGTKGYTCKIVYDGAIQLYDVTGGPSIMP